MTKKMIATLLVLVSMAFFINAEVVEPKTDKADVIFVVDESGSMSGEHAWIKNMVTSLDSSLTAKGVDQNQVVHNALIPN